jgi:Fe-S cluster assembly protein SufD
MNKTIIEQEIKKNAQSFLKTNNSFKKSAMDFFEEHGLPEKLASFFSPRFYGPSENPAIISNIEVIDSNAVLYFENGIFNSINSRLPSGVEISSATESMPATFNDSFEALNALASHAPLFITIKKSTVLLAPITILHTVNENAVNKIVSPRLSMVLEENTEVAILEIFTSLNKDLYQYTTNAYISFTLKDNASLEHVKFQDEAKMALHLGRTNANLSKDSRFFSTVIETGLQASAHHLQINLNEAGAETAVNGVFNLQKNERTNIFTVINHNYSHTHSTQLYKGILKDESFGVFDGHIVVQPDAQQVTSSQLNKNLLLSKKAHVDTRPQLLISADDVKCTHGATVGQLSDEEAFYLETRGIKKERAKEMLINGFSHEIILLIKNKLIRNYFEKKIK